MAWVIRNPLQYVGQQPKGSHHCAALAQELGTHLVPPIPLVALWKPGVRVKGKNLPQGTVIAIFNSNGDYQGSRFAHNLNGTAHTALYVRQSSEGIEVVHQYKGCKTIKGSLIRFGGGRLADHHSGVSASGGKLEDDADQYYVVESKSKPNPEDFAIHIGAPTAGQQQ
jgi:hypothetical protein